MALYYPLSYLKRFGDPPLVVIRRPLDLGDGTLDIGTAYPVDWSDKRQAMRARQYVDQQRIAANPEWTAQHVPGAAKRLGIEIKRESAEGDNLGSREIQTVPVGSVVRSKPNRHRAG